MKNCVQDSGKRSSFERWRRVEHARDAWFPDVWRSNLIKDKAFDHRGYERMLYYRLTWAGPGLGSFQGCNVICRNHTVAKPL